MNAIWTSAPIHVDACLCIDVEANAGLVVLGQLHGEHHNYAADTDLTPEQAYAVAHALIEGADHTLEVQP